MEANVDVLSSRVRYRILSKGSLRSVRSHTASFVAFADATYSASTEEVVTDTCFFED